MKEAQLHSTQVGRIYESGEVGHFPNRPKPLKFVTAYLGNKRLGLLGQLGWLLALAEGIRARYVLVFLPVSKLVELIWYSFSTFLNVEGEKIGFVNILFTYFYHLRAQAKKLKAKHRSVYYVGKWVLILGILWAIFW